MQVFVLGSKVIMGFPLDKTLGRLVYIEIGAVCTGVWLTMYFFMLEGTEIKLGMGVGGRAQVLRTFLNQSRQGHLEVKLPYKYRMATNFGKNSWPRCNDTLWEIQLLQSVSMSNFDPRPFFILCFYWFVFEADKMCS